MALDDRLAERRRLLRLETLYDLALALHAHRPEQELIEELLQRVCAVLDPRAAVAVTRSLGGGSRGVASVGWGRPLEGRVLLADPLWQELLVQGRLLARANGTLAGRDFGEALIAPIAYRGTFLGYLAVLDKEERDTAGTSFSDDDRRFLESVSTLVGVTLDSARQVEDLETEREQLAEENRALRGELTSRVDDQRIVAQSPGMRSALQRLERVAPRGVSVLLRGESGTGKELLAKLLHVLSGRSGPFVALNCAALPESLLESELFGIREGVATGVEARRGKFELADGGTLFLDEIGDMRPALQVKLLRALQEHEVTPLGAEEPVPVNVRLVAATHQDLDQMVAHADFREDLYYRLKGVEVVLPPLRDRREDIPLLVRHFISEFCRREQIEPPEMGPQVLAQLLEYDYPGNVRELQNLIEAAVSLGGRQIDAELVRSLLGQPERTAPAALDLETVEHRHIARILKLVGGNKTRAAEILGIDRRTLQRKGF
jgi:two-component system response regulator HydG